MRQNSWNRYLAGFFNWIAVVSAIVQREIRTRFSGGSLGYGWAIVLPVTWVLAIVVFFVWVGRQPPVAVPLAVFIASGMVPYLIFRQVITAMMRVVRANRHMITLGPTTEEDILTAGAVLELINVILVCVAICAILKMTSGLPAPTDPVSVFLGLILAWGLGASTGRFAASIAYYSDTAQRLTPIVLRPFFWISGIFFVAAELPQHAQNVLWYNPLLHIIEILRTGMLPGFGSDFAQPLIPIGAIALLYFSSRILDSARGMRSLLPSLS